MMFWCSGSGLTFEYPRKLIPWYERPRGGASEWMVDSGVKAEPPTIEQLISTQLKYADVAVSPDILGDPEATAKRTAEWLPEITDRAPHVTRLLATQGTIIDRLRLMDRFPDVHWVGMGLNHSTPGVRWSNEDREAILHAMVPQIHARGKRVHVFGIGCTAHFLKVFRDLRVDSFDSSSPLQAARTGHVYDTMLRQVHIGGLDDADTRRLRVYLNLSQLRRAMDQGCSEQGERIKRRRRCTE